MLSVEPPRDALARPRAPSEEGALTHLRMWAYCLVLAAIAFVQEPGRIVGDTKFDLAVNPVGFLTRALELWEPSASFGFIQNQAYGYFWPMGPFFALGDLTALPPWVTQRLWWTLLLCLAFVGTVKLAGAVGLGRGWTRVLAGFAYALSAHILTLLGPTSVEAWPSALVPWVLLPLVRAAEGGSVRRAAALSALAAATCGGVNAVAVSVVLPLGALWILTRQRGRRRRALMGWWALFVTLATLWWVVPLLILGRYSVPFLDYIENAPITTLPTSLPDVLAGTSDWVAYISPEDWFAGNLLATTPILLLNASVIAAVGLVGILRTDNPHRGFLFLGVLTGAALVGFGYNGPVDGLGAETRQEWLDGALAPFRNLHKYDAVLRLCLVLGLAHFLAVFRVAGRETVDQIVRVAAVVVTVAAVAGVASPAYAGVVAPPRSFEEVPEYWQQAAEYLDETDPPGVDLVVPASRFGDYVWGSPHDDVLQPLAGAPWASRSVLPLGQPAYVRMLDAVTRVIESGQPSATLADFLASRGVSRLVLRNDLDPFAGNRPDPVRIRRVLEGSPGFARIADFGPTVGGAPYSFTDNGIRVLAERGRQDKYAIVEVYAVVAPHTAVSGWTSGSLPVVLGGPAAGLTWDHELLEAPSVLAGDAGPTLDENPRVLTDGLRRRETAFTQVRDNVSATMSRAESWSLQSVVPNHRVYEDQEQWETVVQWRGVDAVLASSAQSYAAAAPSIRRDRHPGAAVDGIRRSQWASSGRDGAVGQWWRVELEEERSPSSVTVRMGRRSGPAVTRLELVTAADTVEVNAPPPGGVRTFALPEGPTDFVEIRAARVEGGGRGFQFTLSEVDLTGVDAQRLLALPPTEAAPALVLLARDDGRSACVEVRSTVTCNDLWYRPGEDGLTLARSLTLGSSGDYEPTVTASFRRGKGATRLLMAKLPVRARPSSALSADIRSSGLAAIDSDPGTAWVPDADEEMPTLRLGWHEPVTLDEISFELNDATPGAHPRRLLIRGGDQSRTVTLRGGRATFAPMEVSEVELVFLSTRPAFSFEGPNAQRLPVGVSEVTFPGSTAPMIDPDLTVDLGCGSGPTIRVGQQDHATRLRVSVEEVMSGRDVPAAPCSDAPITLEEGSTDLLVLPSRLIRAERVSLQRLSGSARSEITEVSVNPRKWTDQEREVTVATRADETLLVVDENFNDGWVAALDGEPLPAQRVDGWRQGFLVPPGEEGTVAMSFAPNRAYQWSLALGLLGLLAVGAAVVLPARRPSGPRVGTSPWLPAALLAVGLGFGLFAAGWFGFTAFAIAIAAGWAVTGSKLSQRWPVGAHHWAGGLAGVLLALAGAVHALQRLDGFEVTSRPAQILAVLGLASGAAAFGAQGPLSFSRITGRSNK